jgi:hypothetical protein
MLDSSVAGTPGPRSETLLKGAPHLRRRCRHVKSRQGEESTDHFIEGLGVAFDPIKQHILTQTLARHPERRVQPRQRRPQFRARCRR